jgi:glycogen debranching enzyme
MAYSDKFPLGQVAMTQLNSKTAAKSPIAKGKYVVDTRPLCQGMRFMLTDAAHPRIVLKHGSHFLILDAAAQIPDCNTLGYGYYRHDTRHISQWELLLDDMPLSLLSSRVDEGYRGYFLYTNPQTEGLPQQKITVLRQVVLSELLWERIKLENFQNTDAEFVLKMRFQSDFADMFEVRGLNRPERGERMLPVEGTDKRSLFLAYQGVDNILLETEIQFLDITPDLIQDGEVFFHVNIPAHQTKTFEMRVSTKWGGNEVYHSKEEVSYTSARDIADQHCAQWTHELASIHTDNDLFDVSLKRSLRDIYILRQPTPKGFGLGAGIPWYCAVFGRDSAITASQMLPFAPHLARESIELLAKYQGQNDNDYTAERPGKIMHELRLGELARSKQIPHSPYYGTVDATQLWLSLFCEYVQWSGDLDFARELWTAVKLALTWLDRATDGGYITYQRLSKQGLENQGWKDSGDSVMHLDGRLAEPPIAICEAQGYLYAAKQATSKIAELLGHRVLATRLQSQAEELKAMFLKDFWIESENYIALALDGQGQQVKSITSNPGHLLASGILDNIKANLVADRLMTDELHTGWGIRTLSSHSVSFNPISYHNGSIWPHDNAIIAEGLRKMGRNDDAHQLMKELFDVAQNQQHFRLPELLCGFVRQEATGPISYPVSCSPQAWAAGSIFQLLKTCINMEPDAYNKCLRIIEPALPEWLETVVIKGLRVGNATLDLNLVGSKGSTFCQITRKLGDLRVIVES